ncbi:dienelactone hydrolase family protein [Halomonas sabkhae]|uniref:alpha/beta hydrolase n=1 Tax=Halomonas sabkhae TaxID=626223 RepID=UPI0025B42511|nr:dienelactone hydrolase family protein [Halomonas sabkhae]MDN3525906.1 dienelactone hydrolase family protein [Halomonas sabkhae]
MSAPEELIIEPRNGQVADACVFILHGLGADGRDFEPLVPALQLPPDANVRFILPHAPRLAVTVNGGMVMPAWYDIIEMSLDRQVDEAQLKESAQRIQALITEQIGHGIAPERIIVVGFSQGGAVAYEAALSFPERLGGLLALSTYLATADSLDYAEANRQLPIEVHHGNMDPVVPESLGRSAVERLQSMGYAVEFRQYPMAHAVCPQQIGDISRWLSARLTAAG